MDMGYPMKWSLIKSQELRCRCSANVLHMDQGGDMSGVVMDM